MTRGVHPPSYGAKSAENWLSLASVQVHYFSAMKSSLFETANGAIDS